MVLILHILHISICYPQNNMNISLLQIILIASGFALLFIIIDAWRSKRLRLIHALVFVGGVSTILLLTFIPNLLQNIANIAGVERWSDFLVYMAIIFLGFMFFSLLQYSLSQQQEMTRLCTQLALREYDISLRHGDYAPLLVDPNSPKDSYLFLIRAYNEASVLASVVHEIITYGFRHIVIVDDGSKDQTAKVVQSLQWHYTGQATIISLYHSINRGPGAANKTLFSFASRYAHQMGYQRCITYDADGQMSIEDMETFMSVAQQGLYDVIIGSRFVAGATTENMPLMRKVILWWGRIVTYVFNGVRLTDVSTGYRAYRVEKIHLITLTSDRFSYQNDIIDAIRQHNLSFLEIPVHIKYTDYSLRKWQSNMSALRILIGLIYSSLFRR